MNRSNPTLHPGALAMGLCIASLTACGGGGSSDTPTAPAALTLSGTASNGSAVAARPVAARCATGTGSTTTSATGAYSLAIEGGALPCVLETSSADGEALHSVATGSGSSATANLTPFTELLVANLAGGDTGAYYAAFGSAAAAGVTAETVAAATAATTPIIASAGVDPATQGNVLTAPVDSAALAALSAALADAHLTLAELSTRSAAGSASNTAPSNSPSLPAALLMKTQASSCAALRSGTYRVIDPHYKTADEPEPSYLASLDASTLVVTDLRDNSAETWTPKGECRYLAEGGLREMVISQAGVGVVRYRSASGQFRVALVIPEQSHTVAELATTWNLAGLQLATGNSAANALYEFNRIAGATISSAGVASAPGVTDSITIHANAAGGFDLVNSTENFTDRYHAYRAGGGELMLVGAGDDGELMLWTPQRAVTLPTVGTRTTSWDAQLNTALVSPSAIGESDFTIDTVDATAGSWTRVDNQNGVIQTLLANNPATGYSFRLGGTGTTTSGASVRIYESTRMQLRGMGMTASWLPQAGTPSAPGIMYLSVGKP